MKKTHEYDASEKLKAQLRQQRVHAPDFFVQDVMNALPEHPDHGWRTIIRRWWPDQGTWLAPSLAGALAMLLIWVGMQKMDSSEATIRVTFELHAPDAGQVELAGSFNQWQVGSIMLEGPDASGRWTVDMDLPVGRHEYSFLVDGREWIADPTAMTYRDDGFGQKNAILEL